MTMGLNGGPGSRAPPDGTELNRMSAFDGRQLRSAIEAGWWKDVSTEAVRTAQILMSCADANRSAALQWLARIGGQQRRRKNTQYPG